MSRSKKVGQPNLRPNTRSSKTSKSEEQYEPIKQPGTKEEWLAAPFWGLEDFELFDHLKDHGLWQASFSGLTVEHLKILTTGILERDGRFKTNRVQRPPAKPMASPAECSSTVLNKLQSQLEALESHNSQILRQIRANEKLLLEYQRSLEYTQATLDATTQEVAALQREVKELKHSQTHRQTPSPPLEPPQPPRKDRTIYVTGLHVDPSQQAAQLRQAVGQFLSSTFPTIAAIVEEVVFLPPQRQPRPGDHSPPPRCLVILNTTDMVDRIMRGAYVLKSINAKRLEMAPPLPVIRIQRQLSYQERQQRSRLWPVFQAAREAGRKAYWKGAVLFIDNDIYTPVMPPSVCSGAPEKTLMSV